jgi:hypothetical protein
MTQRERSKLITQYREGPKQVTDAMKDILPEELDFKINAKTWSCREIVHHLADSEANAGHRLRRILVEHSPYLQGFDQDEFAKKLKYSQRPIAAALVGFRAAVETTAEILEFMTEEDWKRSGEHSDIGPFSAEKWLEVYSAHALGHANQIRRIRAQYNRNSAR